MSWKQFGWTCPSWRWHKPWLWSHWGCVCVCAILSALDIAIKVSLGPRMMHYLEKKLLQIL